MRLLAEGGGDEDQAADSELRGDAVEQYLSMLERPKLPPLLLKVTDWRWIGCLACGLV
jgi:AP-4 complex subunit epsilon-1